ncbi:MAG: DMT family transporter [Lentisphaeria bacterium]|nr:DMT family transporter [Lentisphaeria bacterium]
MMKKVWGFSAMLTATLLWGFAFSAQSSGMDYVGPVVFNTMRSIIAFLALLVLVVVVDLCRDKRLSLWGDAVDVPAKKNLLYGGLWCGIALGIASNLQQIGLKFTTVGKTGFLTALYIIIVPLLGIFFKRRTTLSLWIAVGLALGGTYLLCSGIGNIGKGELLVIAASFFYSLHILCIDHYISKCDCIRLSCVQFAVASVVSTLLTFCAGELWQWGNIMKAMLFLFFCGAGSGAGAFTLQMVSQKYLHPVTASLVMSLESVFAVLGGWIFLNQTLNLHESLGCITIFAAVVLTQVPLVPAKK